MTNAVFVQAALRTLPIVLRKKLECFFSFGSFTHETVACMNRCPAFISLWSSSKRTMICVRLKPLAFGSSPRISG